MNAANVQKPLELQRPCAIRRYHVRGSLFILPGVICSKGSVGSLSNQFTPCPTRVRQEDILMDDFHFDALHEFA